MNKNLFAAAMTAVACQGEPYLGEPEECKQINVFVENPSGELDEEVVLEACALWWREGVQCKLVDSQLGADTKIRLSSDVCEYWVDENGEEARGILGSRHGTIADTEFSLSPEAAFSLITVYIECMYDMRSQRFAESHMPKVIGHELGHHFGIVNHLPNSEGKALMNSYAGIAPAQFETVLDHELWTLEVETERYAFMPEYWRECE